MKARIVLIDDCAPMLRALERVLRNAGHEVHTFSAAKPCEHCLCPAGHACADLVISDLEMPGISGIEFIENQRSQGCRAPYIALVSSDWSPKSRRRAEELGCRVFLKPFAPRDLLAWVDACVEGIDPDRVLDSWLLEGGASHLD